MLKRMIVPLVFGLSGFALLIGLGVWQVQRLAWKEGILAEIGAALAADPVALPAHPEEARDEYRAVVAEGRIRAGGLRVLTSRSGRGPGYRVISAFETGGRVIMVDRGFIGVDAADAPLPAGAAKVTGNLHWPDETDARFTPAPDLDANIWFARDVALMAGQLGAEPVLLVVRATSLADTVATPWPLGISGIANNHFEYAITWFTMAVLWMGMTLYLLWRIRQRTV